MNWHEMFNEFMQKHNNPANGLRGMHADLIITDWPIERWNRVIMFDRRKRLKRKYYERKGTT